MADIPVICIVAGRSETGKTTLTEKVIREFVQRGYKVGAVKSDAHGFDIDVPGKDSWRFAQAGAKSTAIIGPDKYAIIQKTEIKRELDDIIPFIKEVDIILVEGYKASTRPRVEVVRKERGTQIISPLEYLIAIATDVEGLDTSVPILDINDYEGVVNIIVNKYGLKPSSINEQTA
jgi:molybdopterin-guanine dinucleotide biosynthesis adapter protein